MKPTKATKVLAIGVTVEIQEHLVARNIVAQTHITFLVLNKSETGHIWRAAEVNNGHE
jgi:branched-subunit amino acid ABC-type transport system permease component